VHLIEPQVEYYLCCCLTHSVLSVDVLQKEVQLTLVLLMQAFSGEEVVSVPAE
jgi:hypothetical protein